jgi:hypothetical protein
MTPWIRYRLENRRACWQGCGVADTRYIQFINRQPSVTVLPDQRLRIVRRGDVVDPQAAAKDLTKFNTNVKLALGVEDDTYTGCRLVDQRLVGQDGTENISPNNPPAYVLRTYEELPENERVIVGLPGVSYNQFGFAETRITYAQLSNGSTVYSDIVGSSTYGSGVLKTVEGENNGTIRTYVLTYTTGGQMSDTEELKFGGKLKLRCLTYLNQVPPTPSGYTLITQSEEYVNGLRLYKYCYANAIGTGGTGGEISRSYTNRQGGNIAFNPSTPNSATGEVVCTIRYITASSVTANPITQPTGFVLFALDVQDDDGYRMWESRAGFGGGNSIEVSVEGEPDGALVYTVSQNDGAGTLVPAYPGSGTAYNVRITHARDNGFWKNVAVWKKPPDTDTYKKQMEFEEPGIAEFTGTPPQFVLRPPKQRTLLVDVEVSFGTTQNATTPFEVKAYASFYETYTPTDTGIAVQSQRGLGGYLAQASGQSGTNDVYNGVLCDTFSASLLSSIPSTFPTGTVTLKVDNDPYLTAVDGTKVYRRTVITYHF